MRGLTAGDGDDDGRSNGDGGGDEAGRAAVRRVRSLSGRTAGTRRTGGTGWAAGATTLAGFTALALLATGCSSGGTGTRDEGPAGTQPVAQVTPSPGASTAKPTFRVDPVRLVKTDTKVSERVKADLKPCAGSEYPVDTSYGTLTGGSAADVVVNVMTCADSVGVGTYVYRREAGGLYRNVFAMEQPAVYGTIDRGDLVVTAQVYGKKDAVAYPSGEDVITYRWSGDRFNEHDRVHNDFNRAVGSGTAGLPESAEPAGN
ncbi:hypothetical protein ACFYYY_00080 [Streptomyces sp. NPDC001834]|uniref:hypothetical protein n=1 Tax=Streptomyces sp. NPDC001834 TaxID=3364616 RepID=UPI0036C02D95